VISVGQYVSINQSSDRLLITHGRLSNAEASDASHVIASAGGVNRSTTISYVALEGGGTPRDDRASAAATHPVDAIASARCDRPPSSKRLSLPSLRLDTPTGSEHCRGHRAWPQLPPAFPVLRHRAKARQDRLPVCFQRKGQRTRPCPRQRAKSQQNAARA
jgi:hypothetical protein